MSSGQSTGLCSEADEEDMGRETCSGGAGHRQVVGRLGCFVSSHCLCSGLGAWRAVTTTPQASSIGIDTVRMLIS